MWIYLNKTILLCLVTYCLCGCSSDPWKGSVVNAGQYYLEIEHDGLTRGYQLRVPEGYSGSSAMPLHFDIHPWFTNAYIMEKLTGFRPLADQNGFILVQPIGISRSWNAGPKCCSPANKDGIDDVGFIQAIRDDLVRRGLNVDVKKTFLDGMSNGGYLSNRVACEASEFTSGIAVVAGSIGYDNVLESQPGKPVPVLMISGGADNLEARQESFGRWLALNHCSTYESRDIGVFRCDTYTDCVAQVETTHCVGRDVGHSWPGTEFGLYGCNRDLNASRYILDFFDRVGGADSADSAAL